MDIKKKIGNWGESLAQDYYFTKGYKLVEVNAVQSDKKVLGEIDLIVEKDQEIVFVEVKTRTHKGQAFGENAVDYRKKEKLRKAINRFLFHNERYQDYYPRCDILVIEIFNLVPKFIQFENIELT